MHADHNNVKILVTLGGECFEAEFEDKGDAGGRDGVLYYFKVRDLLKDRGVRNVSMFRSGTDRVFVEDYDVRVEIVRWNVLRRAFDSGSFSFESAVTPDRYHELRLKAGDFQPRKKSSDEIIRRFIKFGAYCIGFKWGSNQYVDFNCPEDLDYLGIRPEDIARNVRLLTEEDYLRPSFTTLASPFRVSPTAKLIREFENEDAASPSLSGATVTQHFHIHGHNPRVNMNSTDNSVNVTSVSRDEVFVQLREAARSVASDIDRDSILERVERLEKAQGSSGFVAAYQNFIASAADHMTIFAPFIPALTAMLSGH
jgi:hypothetical protein